MLRKLRKNSRICTRNLWTLFLAETYTQYKFRGNSLSSYRVILPTNQQNKQMLFFYVLRK